MSLKERTYSILVVSSAEKLNTTLSSLMAETHYHPVRFVDNISAARRIWNDQEFDFLVINAPLSDETGIRFAVDAARSPGSVVVLIIRAELYDDVFERVSPRGVFVLSKPLSLPVLTTALSWMESAKERLRNMEQKTLSVEEKMEEIRLVNRAKWVLISELKMEEPQAHRYIEKQAMDRCISRREVAEEIIKTYT